ncbi:MAG: TlpA disulfide reductase family protein [Bacteroidales bacterium]|nr:TlpA disulfide reductase family protein [Bacteroidales bacterium]
MKKKFAFALKTTLTVLTCVLFCSCSRYGHWSEYDLLAANWMYSKNTRIGQEISYDGKKKFPAPDFEFLDMEGQKVRLSDFRGKWVILNFWGVWSEWSMRDIEKLKDCIKNSGTRIELVGIDCGDHIELWESTVKKSGIPGTQLYAPAKSKITKIYNVEAFPSKYLIDPEGNIVYGISGCTDVFFKVMNEYLDEAPETSIGMSPEIFQDTPVWKEVKDIMKDYTCALAKKLNDNPGLRHVTEPYYGL